MKKFFSFFCALFLLLAIIFSSTLSSFAYIECDGKINGYEWEDAEQNVLFSSSGHSGCNYHSASTYVKFIEEDRRVYLALFLENLHDKFYENPEEVGSKIYISFNDSSEILLKSDGTSEYSTDEYFVRFGYLTDTFGAGSYEAEIVLKETDYSSTLTMFLKVADNEGGTSQVYDLAIKSEEMKIEESKSAAESEKNASKKDKTTKPKRTRTTKFKTTKEKTVKETTEFVTAVITENYESFNENQNKRTDSILAIGLAGVALAFGAMCVMILKKEKK